MEKELEKTVKSINEGIESLKEDITKKADVDTLEKKYGELTEKMDKLVGTEDFKKQQDQLDQISTDIKKMGEIQDKSKNPFGEIDKNLKSDDFKAAIKKQGGKYAFETKSILTSDINSGTIEDQVEPGVAKAPWKDTPLYDLVPKGTIGAGRDSISWWELTSETNSAEFVSEGSAASAQSNATWTKQNLDIKMISDYIKVSRSALEDWEYTRSEVVDLLTNGIPRKVEDQLFNGSDLTGLIGQAKSFSKPANFKKVAGANYIDAVRAIATQIMNGDTSASNRKGFMPTHLFVNQGDLMNLRGMKDDDKGYLIPPLGNGITDIDGIRVVPSLDLDADQFLMADMRRAKLYIKRAMRVSFHYENEDDVLKDLVTILASARMAGVKVATPHKFGFVTGTFDAVKAAIEEVIG
jgi:HK97 family phage major capsid protein